MAELDERQESGVALCAEMMGEKYAAAFREAATADGFGSDLTRMAAGWAFHDAWRHPGLTRKEKSIAIITTLIVMRQPLELKTHVKIGIANGLTAAELEGLLIQLLPYVGFPGITSATAMVIEGMREAGVTLDDARTAEERELL